MLKVGKEGRVVEGPGAGLVGVPLGEREGVGESEPVAVDLEVCGHRLRFRMLQFHLTAFNSEGDGATLPLAAFESAVFDGDGAKRGRKKYKGCRKKKGERNEKENAGERKYSCLMNRE